MKLPSFLLFIVLSLNPVLSSEDERKVDFAEEIVPILKEHCFECHGGSKTKGGFSINTRSLFLESEAAVPGDATQSLFLELIEDPDPEYRMPSDDNPPVPEYQVALLKNWVNEGMEWDSGFKFGGSDYEAPLRPRNPELPEIVDGRENSIDRWIDEYLASRDYPRPKPIKETEFMRRVSLDLLGILPTQQEVRTYLSDRSPDKRMRLVDKLLSRKIDYTEHWLTFWNDLLRNDYDGTGFITGGRKQISGWLYESLRENKPFDDMVFELIAPPDERSSGFIDGIKWRGAVSVAQSLPIQFSQSVSQSLLGINMKCASCHDSFVDHWTLSDAYNLAAVYSEEPLELYRCDKPIGETAKATWLFPEIGNVDSKAPKQDRLKQLANLFVHPENGRVPRTIVNRIWGQLMGHGIVHPLDAMETKPWNEDLLDWLAADFQKHGYDLKRTLRLIANSQAYQSQGGGEARVDTDGNYIYSGPLSKRLTAEQFVDSIWQFCNSAPAAFDAPVTRGVVPPGLEEELAFSSEWIWGPSLAEGLAPNGERILLKREFRIDKPVKFAGIVSTADDAFALYLNSEQIMDSSSVADLKAASISSRLKNCENRILIVAENRGSKPNPAGVFCGVYIEYEDGTNEIINTDSNWRVCETVPGEVFSPSWKLDAMIWIEPREVVETKWREDIDPRIGTALANAFVGSDRMPRASLLKGDQLMRSLGRPNRDQIVTSRPSELTVLEAIDLSTSSQLIDSLRKGAEYVIGKAENDRDVLIDEIFLGLLTRFPSKKERALVRNSLGRNPDIETIADLLWALTMKPEFFIIR